jgi:hypothetical protein
MISQGKDFWRITRSYPSLLIGPIQHKMIVAKANLRVNNKLGRCEDCFKPADSPICFFNNQLNSFLKGIFFYTGEG